MKSSRNPIPAQAQMVFKGKIFEVWQWEQKLFDGTSAIFERLRRPNTTIVIATTKDTVLVLEEEQPDSVAPFISIPGGRVDEDEEPAHAIKRELLEETGFESDDWQLLREDNPIGKIEWTIYTYIARDIKKTKEPSPDAGERITSKLISFEDFLELARNESFPEKHLIPMLAVAALDPEKKEELRKLLFKR